MKKATHARSIDEDLNAGVVAPDFDVFVVFQEFLVPLIKDIHCLDMSAEFRPHPEKIAYFPQDSSDVHLNIDPSGKWARDCVVECARCLDGFELPLNLTVGQLEEVEQRITARLISAQFARVLGDAETGQYYSLNEILETQSEMRTILAANRLLVPLLDVTDARQQAESTAINGSHWPYGRGVFVSNAGTVAIWINVQEHLRVLACSTEDGDADSVADVGVAYTRVGRVMEYLEEQLDFRQSYFLGYLASRPSFLGTALRITVELNVPHLAKERENLRHLCTVRGLHMVSNESAAAAKAMRSGTVRVSNMQCIGVTELATLKEFCTATMNIIALERDLSMSNSKQITAMLASVFRRKKNNNSNATDE